MKLTKQLNLLHVFSIASGVMISAGLFILPGLAHQRAGSAVLISYIIAGVLATTGMLSQAELASAMPKAGGTYFYVTRSMGPAVGTVYGLITWMALCLKSSFALVAIGAFSLLIMDMDPRFILIPLCILFVIINIMGIEHAGKIQVVLVLSILTVLLFYAARGFPEVDIDRFKPFAPKGIGAIFSTAGFIFVCYGGLLKVASIAEEVKNPGRVLPLGMIFSLIVVVFLYAIVIFVTVGVLTPDILDNSLTPISDGAATFLGTPGKIVLSIAAILAFITAANSELWLPHGIHLHWHATICFRLF